MSNFSEKIKKQHRINKLKLKAGVPIDDDKHGFIDPKAIKRAQAAISGEEDNYADEIEELLVKLDSTWEDLKKASDDKKVKKLTDELYNYANNVKDMADTFKYVLMGHFGESLREFCKSVDVSKEAHKIIVQAHIDVMGIAFKENIKDEGGPVAIELKKMLAQAIEKHS